MLQHQAQPDEYRVLSALSGAPLSAERVLEAAGLREPHEKGTRYVPLAEEHRALLRRLTRDCRMRWVDGADAGAYVLTDRGTQYLDDNFDRYGPAFAPRRGPALGEVLRAHLPEVALKKGVA